MKSLLSVPGLRDPHFSRPAGTLRLGDVQLQDFGEQPPSTDGNGSNSQGTSIVLDNFN